jgi:RNA polymerase sigma-70 factor (ECF subfamily)
LSRVARGDRAAALACVERYGAELLALVRRLGVDEDAAADAVREIFRALWRELAARRSPPADETAFVFQIARRIALQHESRSARAANPREPAARDAARPGRARPRQSSLFGDVGRVARALAALAPDERAALELAVLNGLPYPRVAFLCGLPTAVARDAARRGLLRVSELLHDDAAPRGEAHP